MSSLVSLPAALCWWALKNNNNNIIPNGVIFYPCYLCVYFISRSVYYFLY